MLKMRKLDCISRAFVKMGIYRISNTTSEEKIAHAEDNNKMELRSKTSEEKIAHAADNNKWNYEASRQDQIPFGSPIGGSLHVSIFEHSRGQALACKFRVDIIFVESAPHRVNLADCRRDGGLDDHKGAAADHNDGAALTRGLGTCHVAS